MTALSSERRSPHRRHAAPLCRAAASRSWYCEHTLRVSGLEVRLTDVGDVDVKTGPVGSKVHVAWSEPQHSSRTAAVSAVIGL